MEAYRFTTKVSDEGIIQLPSDSLLLDREAEVIIVPKALPQVEKMRATDFVNKWKRVFEQR